MAAVPEPAMVRLGHRSRGASSIELALYTPLLFLFVFGIVQFGLAWHANQVASATARETARIARVEGGGPEALAAAQQHGESYAAQVGGSVLHDVTVEVTAVGTEQVRATVRGTAIEIVGGVTPQVEQTVQGPIEQFRPDL